jgi:hypothetical protein
MIHNRRTRRGVSLTEVLVALFIMALGMIALLTLFPLGAMQIGQALKDDRTAQMADQADGYLRMYWRTVHAELIANGGQPGDPLVWAFDDPNLVQRVPALPSLTPPPASGAAYRNTYLQPGFLLPTGTVLNTTAGAQPTPTSLLNPSDLSIAPVATSPTTTVDVQAGRRAGTKGPSCPVMVDPLGVFARQMTDLERYWVAANSVASPPVLIPRRNLLAMTSSQVAFQTCVLTDDMTFDTNGGPTPTLSRQGRYTWAAMLQRPRNEDPSVATMTIMVFDGRPPLMAAPGDEVMVTRPLTVNTRTVSVTIPPRSPDQAALIRRGGWLLDGTIGNVPLKATPASSQVEGVDFLSIRNANFYRVVGVTEVSSSPTGTTYSLDLETPIKPLWGGQSTLTDTGAPITYPGQVYFFAGLSEVFERPVLQPDASYQP